MDKWEAEMGGAASVETNVHRWMARATLDAIGQGNIPCPRGAILTPTTAAFYYQFGTMDDLNNELGKAYHGLV